MNTKLLILDIDNTIFSWAEYYIKPFRAKLEFVAGIINMEYKDLALEAQKVFIKHQSIEYPFTIQMLPSVQQYYNFDVESMLTNCVIPANQKFKDEAYPYLKPYDTVSETFKLLRDQYSDLKIVALTDAPHYPAMWKLNKLGLLHYFDAIYGLEDPTLPIVRGVPAVTKEVLLKHLENQQFGFLGKVRALPNDYEKPGVKGMKTILIDYELDEIEDKSQIVFVGDNLYKDIELSKRMGITSVWCKYGIEFDPALFDIMDDFAPKAFVHRNIMVKNDETPKPIHTIERFEELVEIIEEK